MNKITCDIIKDLLPSYIDEICSNDTKDIVKEHLSICIECNETYKRMSAPEKYLEYFKNTISDKDDKDNIEFKEESALIEKIKLEKEKSSTKNNYKVYKYTSIGLAACIVLSLIFIGNKGGFTRIPDNSNKEVVQEASAINTTDNINNDNEEKNIEQAKVQEYIGIPGNKTLGDYTASNNYSEIYDKIKAQTYPSNTNRSAFDKMMYAFKGEIMMEEEAVVEAPAMDAGAVADFASSNFSTSAASDYSKTNIMTIGVDESDIVKTDGKYIYQATDSEIKVYDIKGGEAKEIKSIKPDYISPSDILREIYVDNDKLTAIIEHYDDKTYKNNTLIQIFDINDPEKPSLVDTVNQDGSYHTSRKAGEYLYLFTDKHLEIPYHADYNEGKNNDSIKKEDIKKPEEWIPTINKIPVAPECIYLPENGLNSLIISAFNIKNPKKITDAKIVANSYSNVYVGDDSIVIYYEDYKANRPLTKLTTLKYKDGKITPGTSESVRGNINDDFAINEYKGYFRLITTDWDSNTNILYILDENLKEKGRINDIARGERLYAARLLGDTGYFVTFRNTDPLFSVDLSDPENPEIIGELHINGFSEYLHFWNNDKLLGIGYEADSSGNRQGLKISMYDISDPKDVTEEAKYILYDMDEAPGFYNYKAILADPNKNLIGFAYSDWNDWENSKYDVYSYDNKNNGFEKLYSKIIPQSISGNARGMYSGNWFYLSERSEVTSLDMDKDFN